MIRDRIKNRIAASSTVRELENLLSEGRNHVWLKGLAGSLSIAVVAHLFESSPRQILYVAESSEEADRAKEDFEALLPKDVVASFPNLPGRRDWSSDSLARTLRLDALEKLIEGRRAIVVASAESALSLVPQPRAMRSSRFELTVGQEADFEGLVARLVELGFTREEMVDRPGEISVRGGLIDLFPHSRNLPVRIEFFGDQIESIREFDPTTQRSRNRLAKVTIYPQEAGDRESSRPEGGSSVLEYLDSDGLIFIEHPELIRARWAATGPTGHQLCKTWEEPESDEERELCRLRWQQFEENLRNRSTLWSVSLGSAEQPLLDFGSRTPEAFQGNLKLFRQKLEQISTGRDSLPVDTEIFFLCETQGHSHRMMEIFEDEGLDLPQLHIGVCGLHRGFVFPKAGMVVYTDHEYYGRVRRLRLPRRFRHGLTLRQLRALNVGDYVVHVDHGIGIYRGLQKITVHGHERECLYLEYRDGDKVFVPLERMDRVQKYRSRDGVVPHVNKLGSPEWERLKARTKKRVQDIARELIALYASRKALSGHAFSADTPWQRELEASFPHEETPDQVRAILDVKKDMESPKPMDRLVCGDVGYGKTEVALRAALKAVLDGKQVAMLVPTTVLAQQHHRTFCQRLAPFPVQIEMLSRFRTPGEQKRVVEGIRNGTVDIVIGTHRLLSRDIKFRDLGLLIIDEEQRFGVRHKERLKTLRATVDVLTLTATPIPRTLHMSLMGARDMSNMNTPPRNRLPIVTEVVPFNRDLIRHAILREIDRGGQVFFVHNRVQSIYKVAAMLESLLPEVSFAVAHGQMRERELERVMLDFVDQKYQVLVSTMIIESGLDIPNVNTILINRADQFGLAQLYQLRGRVGRSAERAYCYLLIPPIEVLTPEAIKRLQTIEEFNELGAGFQIALRDLEIRGAGNLLGAEQSGFIDALGFDLYCKILDDAVAELKEGREPGVEPVRKVAVDTKVEFGDDAFLPQDYVSVGFERVNLYRRLVEADSLQAIHEIRDELRDRFGRLPKEAENLLRFVAFKLLGGALGLQKLVVSGTHLVGYFAPEAYLKDEELSKEWLGSIVQRARGEFEFLQDEGLGFRVNLPETNPYDEAITFLERLLPDQANLPTERKEEATVSVH